MSFGAVPKTFVAPDRAIGLGKSNRGQAEARRFQRARDRPGIGHVIGDILAVVYAGKDEIGPCAFEQPA